MKIAVIGTGYVGLVTAAVFSHFGNQVWALDIDKKKIKKLKKGIIPFYEPGLKELVAQGLKNKNLIFTSYYSQAIPNAKIIFICVGTPAKPNGDYDLSYVIKSVKSMAKYLKNYSVICIKSTVPPSTNKQIETIIKKYTSVAFSLASCPEFLQEGSAVANFLKPSRIIIGIKDKKAEELLLKVHRPIKAPRLICDIKSAQLIKYAANAFLATKISFINSIARICDAIGADIKKVREGLGLDPRIGKKFLQPGIGYGGSCFPKDTWALIAYAQRLGFDFKFLKEVDNVNNEQIDYVIEKIKKVSLGLLNGKIIAILGLAFKPFTDDIREARSLVLIRKLQELGVKVKAYDPIAIANARKVLKKVKFCKNIEETLKNADVLVIVTEWPEFKKIDFQKAAKLMRHKAIVDARNIYEPEKIKKIGFVYEGVGQK